MEFEDGINQIKKAQEKDLDDKLYLRWVTGYQVSCSYDDFKKNLIMNLNSRDDSKNESKDEILANVRKIFMKKVGE